MLLAAGGNGRPELQFELADLLLQIPDAALKEILPSVASWFRQCREVLSEAGRPGGPRFLCLWDRIAELTYHEEKAEDPGAFGDDLLTQSLNSPGGILAWALFDALVASNPSANDGLGPEFKPRFDKIVAPNNMLKLFERTDLSDREFDGLVAKLLTVGLWHQRGRALDYDLKNREIKRALTVGLSSWNFWRLIGDEKGDPADRATRWRQIIGPFFHDVWPLDAALRNEETTRNLVSSSRK